jgi:hypothetical protein
MLEELDDNAESQFQCMLTERMDFFAPNWLALTNNCTACATQHSFVFVTKGKLSVAVISNFSTCKREDAKLIGNYESIPLRLNAAIHHRLSREHNIGRRNIEASTIANTTSIVLPVKHSMRPVAATLCHNQIAATDCLLDFTSAYFLLI